jgi:hypothetical protein
MMMRTIAAALLALALSAGAAAAQAAAHFVVAEVTAPDGKKSFPFGETPKGILIFTADGRFAQIHFAGDVPKIASNNRLTGSPEEYAEIMRRSLSVFGTYTVDEAGKTITYNIVSASFPNWQGEARPAPSTSSHRTNSSTPTATWPVGAAAPAIFTGGRSSGGRRPSSRFLDADDALGSRRRHGFFFGFL